jgi:hypothetical protein
MLHFLYLSLQTCRVVPGLDSVKHKLESSSDNVAVHHGELHPHDSPSAGLFSHGRQ